MKEIIIVEGNNKYVFSNEKEVVEQFLGKDFYKLSEKEQYQRLKLRTLMNATFRGMPARDIKQGDTIKNVEDMQYIIWDEETFLLSLAKNNDIVMYEKENVNILAKGIDKEALERISKEYIRINDCANEILKKKIDVLGLENHRENKESNPKERS